MYSTSFGTQQPTKICFPNSAFNVLRSVSGVVVVVVQYVAALLHCIHQPYIRPGVVVLLLYCLCCCYGGSSSTYTMVRGHIAAALLLQATGTTLNMQVHNEVHTCVGSFLTSPVGSIVADACKQMADDTMQRFAHVVNKQVIKNVILNIFTCSKSREGETRNMILGWCHFVQELFNEFRNFFSLMTLDFIHVRMTNETFFQNQFLSLIFFNFKQQFILEQIPPRYSTTCKEDYKFLGKS